MQGQVIVWRLYRRHDAVMGLLRWIAESEDVADDRRAGSELVLKLNRRRLHLRGSLGQVALEVVGTKRIGLCRGSRRCDGKGRDRGKNRLHGTPPSLAGKKFPASAWKHVKPGPNRTF